MARKPRPTEVVLEVDPGPDGEPVFISTRASTTGPLAAGQSGDGQQGERLLASMMAEDNRVDTAAPPERLVLTAEREIVLQVGKASITLTQAGKIILRGTYVLSRSSGVNRIKGGSVEIN